VPPSPSGHKEPDLPVPPSPSGHKKPDLFVPPTTGVHKKRKYVVPPLAEQNKKTISLEHRAKLARRRTQSPRTGPLRPRTPRGAALKTAPWTAIPRMTDCPLDFAVTRERPHRLPALPCHAMAASAQVRRPKWHATSPRQDCPRLPDRILAAVHNHICLFVLASHGEHDVLSLFAHARDQGHLCRRDFVWSRISTSRFGPSLANRPRGFPAAAGSPKASFTGRTSAGARWTPPGGADGWDSRPPHKTESTIICPRPYPSSTAATARGSPPE
jgi:hypothetical protein